VRRLKRTKWRTTVVAVPALFVFTLSACQDVLTADGTPYDVTVNGTSFTVTNVSAGPNESEALIPSSEPGEAASSSCATWDSGVTPAENGIMFRAASQPQGWNGVSIQRTFVEGPADGSFTVIYYLAGNPHVGESVNLSSYLGTSPLWPIRICAQITGSYYPQLSFAIAKGSDAMVPLGTPGRGATFNLNAYLTSNSGQTGTLVAHVARNNSVVVSDVTIDGSPAPSPTS
jgi:hypothetical protein